MPSSYNKKRHMKHSLMTIDSPWPVFLLIRLIHGRIPERLERRLDGDVLHAAAEVVRVVGVDVLVAVFDARARRR